MAEEQYPDDHPKQYTNHAAHKLQELMDYLRDAIGKVDDPQAEALFETSAEVLGGLKKAFQHFETKNEEAWRGQ